MRLRGEGTALSFRLEMVSRLDYVMSPLWGGRKVLLNNVWGALIAFEQGYLDGVEFVENLIEWDNP